jgi:hypothetical protein
MHGAKPAFTCSEVIGGISRDRTQRVRSRGLSPKEQGGDKLITGQSQPSVKSDFLSSGEPRYPSNVSSA